MLEAANGQPPRLVLEFEEVDRTAFVQSLAPENRPELRPGDRRGQCRRCTAAAAPAAPTSPPDTRPVVVIDPGHGGPDNGTEAGGNDKMEKNLVLSFGLALRDRLEKSGKYRVVMTRTDDTFIPLDDRVKVARNESAALFISIHADALPRARGRRPGRHHLYAVGKGVRSPRPSGWRKRKTSRTPSAGSVSPTSRPKSPTS